MPSNPFADRESAETYDPWYEMPLGATMDRLQKDLVLSMAQPTSGEKALDVGTGTGNYACTLAGRGLEVTGVDPAEAMLAVARQKPCSVTWQQAIAEELPFEDGQFDLVLSVTALEFVADPEKALGEMYRVIAPGGRLVIGTLNAESAWGRLYAEQAAQDIAPFRDATLYNADRFAALLSTHGRVAWSSAGFVPPSGKGLAWADLIERLGRVLARRKGALLVGRVDK